MRTAQKEVLSLKVKEINNSWAEIMPFFGK
jgi:hypothetical protein